MASASLIENWSTTQEEKSVNSIRELKGSDSHLKACKNILNGTKEPTTAKELYGEYKKAVKDPRSFKQFRFYLRQLKDLGISYEVSGNSQNHPRRSRIENQKIKENHQEVLKDIIPSDESASMNELYPEYEERVREPKVRRTVRNYLTDLAENGEIEKLGNGKGTEYQRVSEGEDFEAVSVYLKKQTLRKIQEKAEKNSRSPQEEFNEVLEIGLERSPTNA